MSFLFISCAMLQGVAMASEEKQSFRDLEQHWAASTVESWSSKNLITGYADGSFKPDAFVTRAQFIALVNRAFGYIENAQINYVDVSKKDWFYTELQRAKAIGYISGYENGQMKPDSPITREEAAVIVSRILRLQAASDQSFITTMKDANRIAKWSKDMVNTVLQSGYMKGYDNGSFKPTSFITRAESVVMLDRVAGEIYSATGTYGTEEVKTFKGNVTINVKGVTIKNAVIEGNLYLTEGIGQGDIVLENVTVKGKTLVGGSSVLKLSGEYKEIELLEKVKNVQIQLDKAAKIRSMTFNAAAEVIGQGQIEKAIVNVAGVKLEKSPTKLETKTGIKVEIKESTPGEALAEVPLGGGGGGAPGAPAAAEEIKIHTVSLKIGGSDATVTGINDEFTIDLGNKNNKDMFTQISVNASSNAKKAEVRFAGMKREISLENGSAVIDVSSILGSLDPQGDGISVSTLKTYSEMLGNSITVTVYDGANNKTDITVELKQ